MTPVMRAVLVETLRRQEALKAQTPPPAWKTWEWEPYDDAQAFGPAWAPGKWFGGPLTDAERMGFVRAVHALARLGLVEVTRDEPGGHRIAHVMLTPPGVEAARKLLPG
jgi:hypothetical protein